MESVCGLLSDKQYDGQNCGGKLILLSVSGKKNLGKLYFWSLRIPVKVFYTALHMCEFTRLGSSANSKQWK